MRTTIRISLLITAVLAMALGNALLMAQNGDEKRVANPPNPEPVLMTLWTPPVNLASRDLFNGPGGADQRPNLRRVTFIEDQKGGYSKKFKVRDASGREWVAKVGNESQAETAAVRLLWAVGYNTEVNYLVPRVNIRGKGTFDNVRFEARPENVKRTGEWEWERNPFTGSRELQGLKIMMALLNNWDLKDSNNEILTIKDGSGSGEMRYVISDLGATFGKQGNGFLWRLTRSRNKPDDYQDAKFIDGIKGNHVDFNYTGVNSDLFDNVTIDDAAWIAHLLSQLSDRQLSDAFRAANYNRQDQTILTRAVRARINELRDLTAQPRGVTVSN